MLKSKVWGGTRAGFANNLTITVADIDGDGDFDLIGGFSEGGLICLRDPRSAVPVGLQAFPAVASVLLTWDPNRQTRIMGYYVYRKVGDGDYERITPEVVKQPRFEDLTPQLNALNYYKVSAVRGVVYPGTTQPILIEGRSSDEVQAQPGLIRLWLSDTYAKSGGTAILQINLLNATGLAANAMEIQVHYDPSILTPILVEKTIITKDLTLSATLSRPGLLIISTEGEGILRGRGNIFDVYFQVKENVPIGTESFVTVPYARMYDANGNSLRVEVAGDGIIIVSDRYFPGDVNGDGIVDQNDVELCLELAVGKRKPTNQELAAADLNGNGIIDRDDARMVSFIADGKSQNYW